MGGSGRRPKAADEPLPPRRRGRIVDAAAANLIGYNAGNSLDVIVREVLAAGTNVIYGGGGATAPSSRTTVAAEDIIAANDVRKVTAALRGANVSPWTGYYIGFIHPDVSYDLRR